MMRVIGILVAIGAVIGALVAWRDHRAMAPAMQHLERQLMPISKSQRTGPGPQRTP